jgi:cytochrome c biogenesis protein CcmG, thiol:disulfide interchange protein DsbE
MKKKYCLMIFFIANALLVQSQKIPSVPLINLEGNIVNTGIFSDSNKPVVLCFWATWCIPCINELTAINDKLAEWKKESSFELYAVAVDDSRTAKKVQPLVYGKAWDFTVLLDKNQDLKRGLNLANIPYSMVIKNGKAVYKHPGYVAGDEDELYSVIKANQ